ncbi:MAG: MFS transporter [Streptosporangiales bacterium]|nr:MFS transporter [Streptosporangiales bacterium]
MGLPQAPGLETDRTTPSAPGTADGDDRPGRRGLRARLLLPVLSLAMILVSVLLTLVVPLTGQIADQLGASPEAAGWVITSTLLAAAVFTPLLGRLGDIYGPRPVLIGILVTLSLAALLAATTTSIGLLIVARVMQGTSYGIFPLAMSVLRADRQGARLNSAMAVVSGMLAVGGGVGLVSTGLLTQAGGDYHRVFWLAFVVCLLTLAGALVAVPRGRSGAGGRVDWAGAALLGLGLMALLLPISQGHAWGWGSPRTIGLFAASVVLLGLWLVMQRRLRHPLVAPRMLTHRPILVVNLAGMGVGTAMFLAFLGVADYVQTDRAEAGYGFSASVMATSAVYLLPGTVAAAIVSQFAGRVVNRLGARATLVTGALLGALGFVLLALGHSVSWGVVAATTVLNCGVSLIFATLPSLLADHVPASHTGIANSVNSIARSVGSSVASAFIATLLASTVLPATGHPGEWAYTLIFGLGALVLLVTAATVTAGLRGARAETLATA